MASNQVQDDTDSREKLLEEHCKALHEMVETQIKQCEVLEGQRQPSPSSQSVDVNKAQSMSFIEEFKSVYTQHGKHNLKVQIPYLGELAAQYEAKYKETLDWTDAIKAHSLYNSCAARADDPIFWLDKAFRVQEDYWGEHISTTPENLHSLRGYLLEKLRHIRKTIKNELVGISSNFKDELIDSNSIDIREKELSDILNKYMPSLSIQCSQSMISFSKEIIASAVSLCGQPPCDFAAVAIGSLAKGEATPYSDLEFMFLIAEESESNVEYFVRLAVTVYFVIGTLGETKLRYMNIAELEEGGWFKDEAVNGFKIDGLQKHAGNIPTGNGSKDQHNHFILTVNSLIEKYRNIYLNPDPKESVRGDFSAMLASTVLIYGSDNLYKSLEAQLNSIQANNQRRQASLNMIYNDVKKFDFLPNVGLRKILNVKMDFYRYPSIVLFDLKIYFEIHHHSSSSIIQELLSRKLISASLAHSLTVLFYAAQFLRLSTYLHHESQSEEMTILTPSEISTVKRPWKIPKDVLLYMCCHLIPVKKSLAGSLENMQMFDGEIARNHNMALAITYYYSGNFKEFLECMTSEHPDGFERVEIKWRHNCMDALVQCKQYEQADKLIEYTLEHSEQEKLPEQMWAGCMMCKACMLSEQGQHKKGMEYFKQVSPIIDKYEEYRNDKMLLYQLQAGNCQILGQYEEALRFRQKMLYHYLEEYGHVNHLPIAESYQAIGDLHRLLKHTSEAIKYYELCLTMLNSIHEGHDNAGVARLYNGLALLCQDNKDYEKAVEYNTKSLEICLKLYEDGNHPHIAESYVNLGAVYSLMGDKTKSMEFMMKGITSFKGFTSAV